MKSIILNPKKSAYVAKPLTPMILAILREYTEAKSNLQLGEPMGIKSPHVAIPQMNIGRINLQVEKLHNLARRRGISYEELLGIIYKRMLVVSDQEKRQTFLDELQGALGSVVGDEFHQKLNGQEVDFLQNGNVPLEWIKLVPDQENRIRIIADHCIDPEMLKRGKRGKKAVPTVDAPTKKEDPVSPQGEPKVVLPVKREAVAPEKKEYQHSPQEQQDVAPVVGQETVKSGMLFTDINEVQLLNALSQATQNVGQADRFKLNISTEVLLGTIVSQMLRRNYSINIRITGGWEFKAKLSGESALQQARNHEKEEVLLEFQGNDGKFFSWKVDPQHFLTDKLEAGKKGNGGVR